MSVRAGQRLRSAVSVVEVIVIRPPGSPDEITCDGLIMTPADDAVASAADGPPTTESVSAGEVSLGKRYVDEVSGVELLCVKAGPGVLAAAGRPLTLKQAKPLPASD